MPAGRAYWKGFLRLSLVSIPVSVFNAVDSGSEISFRQIHKPSGKRVNYEKTVPGLGKIDNADIVKGYEVDKDQYVIIEPDEIDSIKLDSKQTIDLVQFVDIELDNRYFERPYFLVPTGQIAEEGYVVIRDALRKTGKVGLAKVTIAGREWLVAISPLQDGLTMALLRYANELKDPAQFFDEIPSTPPQKAMVDLAVQLIEQKSTPFDPAAFSDAYATALKALVQDKIRGKVIVASPEQRPSGANVVDLMAALQRSLAGNSNDKPAKTPKSPKTPPAKGKSKRA
jgi:DNA end-binding protein Ku